MSRHQTQSIVNCLFILRSVKVHREVNGSPSPRGSRGHPRQQPQTESSSSSRAKRQENLRWAADLSLSEGTAPAHWQEQITHLQKQLNFSTTMCQTLLQDQQVREFNTYYFFILSLLFPPHLQLFFPPSLISRLFHTCCKLCSQVHMVLCPIM